MVKPQKGKPKEKRLYEVRLPQGEFPAELKREKYRIRSYSPLQALSYALIQEGQSGMLRYFKPRLDMLVKDITPEKIEKEKDQLRLPGF
jgi:hypothetical protein